MAKIKCEICGEQVHAIQTHLQQKHSEMNVENYRALYPNAPVFSPEALAAIEAAQQKEVETVNHAALKVVSEAPATVASPASSKKAFHEVFGFDPATPGVKNSKGGPIPVTVLGSGPFNDMVPEPLAHYVHDLSVLKDFLLAIELAIPVFVYGQAGTGKTEMVKDMCARTNRPLVRVQHTIGTEEAHVLGQWIVKGGETIFQPGLLALAMKHGWVYLADEYDFALPSVTALYQPVLEPNPTLVIKDADPEHRVIKAHPNFRFVATGNTNGAGDEHGIYQGALIGNAANYERFGMMLRKHYMPKEKEIEVLMKHTGIKDAEAHKLIDFATRVREAFDAGRIGIPISPRALINAANIGIMRGDIKHGLERSFIARLNRVDREAAATIVTAIFE